MEKQYKLITLGSFGVGKTCILMHATDTNFTFTSNYICTIGVDYKIKTHNFQGQVFKLSIWDTAGQERFYNVNRFYFDGCHGVILVYDVTCYESFEKIPSYIEDFQNHCDSKPCFVLVGNKCDAKNRQVGFEEGKKLALKFEIPFLECSAMSGYNVEEIFDVMLTQMQEKSLVGSESKSSFCIHPVRKKKKCCF